MACFRAFQAEYIKINSQPDSRMIFPSHQSYGVLWHSERKGYPAIPTKAEAIEFAVNEKGVEWIFVYQWGMNVFNEPSWEYIQNNFELKQVAFEQVQGQNQPVYFLLRYGGSFNLSNLNNLILTNLFPTVTVYCLLFSVGTRLQEQPLFAPHCDMPLSGRASSPLIFQENEA